MIHCDPGRVTGRTCPHCDGLGVLRWQQAIPTAAGFVLREMEHPCPMGCGPTWHYPAAEADVVVESGAAEDPGHQGLVERAE
ncbi:hypothetical protein GCM10023148_29910 [Actinokineospora soli]